MTSSVLKVLGIDLDASIEYTLHKDQPFKALPHFFPRLLGITGITMFSVKIVRKWHPPPPLTEYNILRRGVGPRKR